MKRPNVLLILTDQQRVDSLGCYGGGFVPTPHIDALAGRGTVFDRCYVNNPICTPSRASIWTGRSILGHGVYNLHDVLSSSHKLFPEHLRTEGYRTGLFGKLHVSGRSVETEHPHPHHGFDVYEYSLSPYNFEWRHHSYRDWLRCRDPVFYEKVRAEETNIGFTPENVHFSTWITERSIEFINSTERDQPFFCCCSFVDPHDPFDDHPEEYLSRVRLGSHETVDRTDRNQNVGSGVLRERDAGVLGSLADYCDEDIIKMRRSYYASVGFIDTCVGRLVDALREPGHEENTLVIFSSDHGEMLGGHGLLGKGAYFYESCARVPLIACGPGATRGARSSALVQLHDIADTVLSAAGVDAQVRSTYAPDSKSVLTTDGHEYVVSLYRNSGINRHRIFWDPPIHATMICGGRFKLTVYHTDARQHDTGELYDLETDPEEKHNLWDEDATRQEKATLLRALMNWFVSEDLSSRAPSSIRSVGAKRLPNNPIKVRSGTPFNDVTSA